MSSFQWPFGPPKGSPTQGELLRQAEPFIMWVFGIVFVVCGITSGYATFTGIHLFLAEVGGLTFIVSGTALVITIAVTCIQVSGWAVIVKWGPEAPTSWLRFCMLMLGTLLFVITISVSSLSNLMTLAGPAAKVFDWNQQQLAATVYINAVERQSLGIKTVHPAWQAEQQRTCSAAKAELEDGTISGSGRGQGPVVAALSGICALTTSFNLSIERALTETDKSANKARGALVAMRMAIRDRNRPVIEREDLFLDAGELLNSALLKIRSADLKKALDAGAKQVEASVAELSQDSSFSRRQVESVSSIRAGLAGLVQGTNTLVEDLSQNEVGDFEIVSSPDYIAAIFDHAPRFVPVFAAAIGIDTFMIWALSFMLVHKAGYRSAEKHTTPSPKPAPMAPRRRYSTAKTTKKSKPRSSNTNK